MDQITFDPVKAREWMIVNKDNNDTRVVSWFMNNEDWGICADTREDGKDDVDDEYPDDLSSLLAAMPADVLTVPAPGALQLDGVYDPDGYRCRITVTLPNGVTLADSTEDTASFLPTQYSYDEGTVVSDGEYPQLSRLFYAIEGIVAVGNQLIEKLHLWYEPRPEPAPRSG